MVGYKYNVLDLFGFWNVLGFVLDLECLGFGDLGTVVLRHLVVYLN